MLKDGTLPPNMKFEDDNIRRYDPRRSDKGQMPSIGKDYVSPATQSWMDQSDKFSKDARDLKKQLNQGGKLMSKRKPGKA